MTMAKATGCSAVLAVLLSSLAASAAVPTANCRKNDKTESGLQGLTTPAEIASGAAAQGFNCNADIVGQYQGEGASWQLTAWKNCAYFDQTLNSAEAHPGTVVVDVSDPKNPKPTAWLADNAMLDPWESLKVNNARQLLAGDQKSGTGFTIYDISKDCLHPTQTAPTINIPGMFGHTGQWAPDGNTYYITPLRTDQTIIAVDTKDPAHPAMIPCTAGTYGCGTNGFFTAPSADFGTARWHDLEFSKDGNTAYISMLATGDPAVGNGLVLLDVSDFQSRKPNPAYRVISQLTWDDGSVGAQNALQITIKGKPYVLFTDESGTPLSGCSKGKSGGGFPRLIDVSDPKHPVTAAKLILQIHDPANCNVAATTPITSPAVTSTGSTTSAPFGFSCHYCNVDDVDNAKLAACNCFAAGLRIFDISNVSAPKEVAYLKPPAQGTKALPASQYATRATPGYARNFDWATSKPSFPKDRGMTSGDLWTTSQDNGFMVVKLDSSVTGGSGGCSTADPSLGGLIAFALTQMIRRRRLRSRV
jgi:hypothetical protein